MGLSRLLMNYRVPALAANLQEIPTMASQSPPETQQFEPLPHSHGPDLWAGP